LVNKILFHALNDAGLDELVENRNPTYCSNLLSSLHGEGVKALSTTALVNGAQVDTYRGTGIILDTSKTTLQLIAKGDANAGTDTKGNVTGQRDCESAEELCNYVRNTPIGERKGMNEVKCDFERDAIAGFSFRASTAPTAPARQRENNIAYLKMSLLQKHFKENVGVDCKIYTYEHEKGKLQLVQKESERKQSALNIVKQSFGDEAKGRLQKRLDW
jgi:hypothetical protein